ncbi:AtpZ/AtpI family protein [Candidatus Gracilibacteria bacterium]|nr:AtpZ/AtpI family protein [Candidatus Gracilibacteria bacterium]
MISNKKSNTASLMSLAMDLGFTIAIPIVLFGLGGALLDRKLGTSPLFLLIGVVLSIVITSIGIYRKIKSYKLF